MKAKKDVKQSRNQYSPEFKKQALDRAEKDGVADTARDLKLKESQLYAWRQKKRLEGSPPKRKSFSMPRSPGSSAICRGSKRKTPS